MATANELLARLTGSDERVCVIDLDTRQINIPKNITALGVASDDDVHRLKFRMPRYYTGTDLSELEIRINYMNAKNEPDVYPVDDKSVNNDSIEFGWLVGPHALAYKGNVNFIVCMKKTGTVDGEENVVLNEFNTTVATLPVLEGLEVDVEPIEGELYDLLATLQSQIGDAVLKATEKVIEKRDEVIGNIETKQRDVLASIPEDWQTTYNLYRTRANAITKTVEGETIVLDDSSDDYLRGLTLYGKSTQVSTTGKNLLNVIALNNPAITVNENGIAITPTSTGTAVVPSITLGEFISAQPGETVVLSGSTTGQKLIYIIDTKTSWAFGKSITLTEEMLTSQFYLYGGINPGTPATITDFMVYYPGDDVDSTYEPYSGGVASPSPEWPQSIESPGNITGISMNFYGKNLLEPAEKNETTNGVTCIMNSDGSVTVNGTATANAYFVIKSKVGLVPGYKYKLTGCPANGSFSTYLMYYHNNVTGKDFYDTGNGVNFTPTSESSNVVIAVYKGTTVNSLTFYPMIRLVSVKNETFETYIAPQTGTLPITLPGIPVSAGGNYTDENGQQWVCDEMDFERGLYIQRIYTETCKLSRDNDSDRYTGTTTRSANLNYVTGSGIPVLCDILPFHPQAANGQPTNGIRISASGASFIAARYDDVVLSEVTISYPLATPIIQTFEEKFGKETATALLAAYSALHSNYPTTTVVNDQGAHMEVKYNVDTQKYLESCYRPTDNQVQEAVNLWLDEHPDVTSVAPSRLAWVSIPASAWVTDEEHPNLHSQVISVDGVTEHSKVDLLPTVEQLAIFHEKDVTFTTENEGGVVTFYAIGDKPTLDYDMQVQITEVGV